MRSLSGSRDDWHDLDLGQVQRGTEGSLVRQETGNRFFTISRMIRGIVKATVG